ncbi:hypothetical protein E4U27_005495 [Claviceps purpurea]|nr:hypothetical protein E4U27_005495 [Claviceps purpurea]
MSLPTNRRSTGRLKPIWLHAIVVLLKLIGAPKLFAPTQNQRQCRQILKRDSWRPAITSTSAEAVVASIKTAVEEDPRTDGWMEAKRMPTEPVYLQAGTANFCLEVIRRQSDTLPAWREP